jgi:hypothetical protein
MAAAVQPAQPPAVFFGLSEEAFRAWISIDPVQRLKARDKHKYTPLFAAAQEHNSTVVEWLLSK